MRIRPLLAVLSLVAFGVPVAACSSSSDPSPSGGNGTDTPGGNQNPGPTPTSTSTAPPSGTSTAPPTGGDSGVPKTDGGGGGGDGGGDHDGGGDGGGGGKAFGEQCNGDAECASKACFMGGQGSYCSIRCTKNGQNDPGECPNPPSSGLCNNQGYCKM